LPRRDPDEGPFDREVEPEGAWEEQSPVPTRVGGRAALDIAPETLGFACPSLSSETLSEIEIVCLVHRPLVGGPLHQGNGFLAFAKPLIDVAEVVIHQRARNTFGNCVLAGLASLVEPVLERE